jgi:hypothetical protein
MTEFITSFGENAGKLWKMLNDYGPLSQTDVVESVGLENNDFYAAVGWLARENKISSEGELFKLGETNLSNNIGHNAGKVWQVLDIWEDIDVSSISQLARLDEKDVLVALGWLAREGKIETKMISKKHNIATFQLK